MICKISCSIGELIDKVSILKIKLQKSNNKELSKNISKELELITRENPISNVKDNLFLKLYEINNKLWILEDNIRIKSQNNDFDSEYIQISEKIHKYNDQRYMIKNKINAKYFSDLKEEKIYTSNIDTQKPKALLENGKYLYTNGSYEDSYKIIYKLMNIYKDYTEFDAFFVDLLFSYSNITSIFKYENIYFHKIETFMKTIDSSMDAFEKLSKEQIIFCKELYVMQCLYRLKYNDAKKYLGYYNSISGPNVNNENISFFKKDDIGKTLLIYDGGGLGDKFMLCRFIPILCEKYRSKKHRIVFFIDDKLLWIFSKLFKNINNLTIISYNNHGLIPKFDYHTNLIKLIDYLDYDYNNLPKQLFINSILNENICKNCKDIVSFLKSCNKKKYILNWFGGSKNNHEKYNRKMDLLHAIPLLKQENIQWVVISKNVNENERIILSKYNVLYCGDYIDNEYDAFRESVHIINNVDGLISTDTCLVHISPSLNIKTFVLLTIGNEWRWSSLDNKSYWYPDSILIKQTKYGDWKDVINRLSVLLFLEQPFNELL
tara:strand:- start:34681 stop:36321 length:1641 start_codon:yes stop_codon:yes gene_type:complete